VACDWKRNEHFSVRAQGRAGCRWHARAARGRCPLPPPPSPLREAPPSGAPWRQGSEQTGRASTAPQFHHPRAAPSAAARRPALASTKARAQRPLLQEDEFCDEFHLVDLRLFENCKKVVSGCDHAFHMAADMGGMGFIQSNHSVILYNNTMISYK
jgi:hypothetical protein